MAHNARPKGIGVASKSGSPIGESAAVLHTGGDALGLDTGPAAFLAKWRAEREKLSRYGQMVDPTLLLDDVLREAELAFRAVNEGLLRLSEAAAESRYSASHLARLVRDGKIPNAGRPHAPRIRRTDLPRKVRSVAEGPSRLHLVGASATQVARSLVNGGRA
jgi:hypothetical protein